MRSLLLMALIAAAHTARSQQTVETARLYKVNLYFGEAIRDMDVGDPLYFQTENDTLLNKITIAVNPSLAPAERETNMNLVSANGNVYAFILKTVDGRPRDFNIEVPMDKALFSVKGAAGAPAPPERPTERDSLALSRLSLEERYKADPKAYYRDKIFYHIDGKSNFVRVHGRNGKVYLHLDKLYYNMNEIYLFLRLENKERLDYKIGSIRYSVGTVRKKKNSYQQNAKTPLYEHSVPKRVSGEKAHRFALVFQQFGIERNKALFVDIDEADGDRKIQLAIDAQLLNNPKRF